jgi:hypothetical protein
VVQAAGFRIARIRYYTPIVGGLIENVFLRLAEQQMARRARRRVHNSCAEEVTAVRHARTEAKARIARRGPLYVMLRGLTLLMKLDLILFGRIRSGPFFALLVKQ